MKCNVGKNEQVLRIGIGSVMILSGLYNRRWWGIFGLVPIITGVLRYCPMNAILGIQNCKAEKKTEASVYPFVK